MENEVELGKDHQEHTDDGYSEKKLAKQVDLLVMTKPTAMGGNVFTPKKNSKIVFQAQNDEEK